MTESNIEKQLIEIEILKSIYPNSNEFQIEDEDALFEAQIFAEKKDKLFKRNLGFIIKLNADIKKDDPSRQVEDDDPSYTQLPLEIVCRLPISYPLHSPPNVFVRCSQMNLNRKISEELSNFITSSHENDCSILNIIEWIKDNVHRFLNNNKSSKSDSGPEKKQNKFSFSRMWIYSHHIYSLNKRKTIIQWAKDLDLNGFSKPGKPGVICVEGTLSNVQEYITRLKSLNWQRLTVKEIETFEIDLCDLQNFMKFENFEEKVFTSDNNTTIDLGLLFTFLKEKGLESIFNLYFGVDGKESIKT